MEPVRQPALTAALDRLWVQFLPQIEERVAILETAAQAVTVNQLSIEQHQGANAAAHKLAGVLGTFGLTRGTVLARELEMIYSSESGPDPSLGARLTESAVQLRAIVATRK